MYVYTYAFGVWLIGWRGYVSLAADRRDLGGRVREMEEEGILDDDWC